MNILESPNPPAGPGVALGFVTDGAQQFAGAKILALATAIAGQRVLTLGTTVADASSLGLNFLSMRTGIGATEREWVRFKRPDGNVGDSVLKIDQTGGPVNTFALDLVGIPSGLNGIRFQNSGNYDLVVGPGQFGSPAKVAAENKGLLFAQNANAYDTSTLMRFAVNSPSALPTIPAFDFEAVNGLAANQPLVRWRHNGTERARMLGLGSLVLQPGVNQWGIGLASEMNNVAGGVWYDLPNATFGFRNMNGVAFLGLNIESGLASCSGNFLAGNELESGLVGGGVIVRSPNGTRWRIGVSNAGTLTIAAA